MADKEAPDKNIYLSSVIRIQALLRGALVRKQIKDVKNSFEAVFQDLERSDAEQVEWESVLSVPKIAKRSARKEQQNVKSSAAGIQAKDSSVQETKKLCTFKDKDIHTDDSKFDHDNENLAKFNSVEVQTSFIDNYRKSIDDRQNLNGLPEHDTEDDNHVLEDLDTSWKDRVVPFIQNNDFGSENEDNKVSDFHLDLNTDRESFCGRSSKSETSDKRFFKHSPRESGSNIHQRTPRSVESIEENCKGSLEHSNQEINQNRASDRPTRPDNTSRSSRSSKQLEDVEDSNSQEFQYSNRSEPRSSVSKSGHRHSERRDNFDSEKDKIEKDSSSEKSARFRSANSCRSHNSDQSEAVNELESPKVHSSRSRTSNKSEKSDRSKAHSGSSNNKSSSRHMHSGGISDNGASKQYRHEGSASDKPDRSNRSDRSAETEQLSNRSEKCIVHGQQSHRSDGSVERGQWSDRSNRSVEHGQHSNRSDKSVDRKQYSHRSDRSVESEPHSHRSTEPGQHSDKPEGRSRSESVSSQKSISSQKSARHKTVEVMPPPRSSVSPVAFHPSSRDDRQHVQDSTTLTNVTSVWDSFNSVRDSQSAIPDQLPQDATSLKELRKNISMELLWVQQAIDSRKNYLKLKGKM